MAINPDAALIPDQAEVWIVLKSAVSDIASMIPETATIPAEALEAMGWEEVGIVDDKKGIPLDPSGEVKEYDGFGHPAFQGEVPQGQAQERFHCAGMEFGNPQVRTAWLGQQQDRHPQGHSGVPAVSVRR
ncbi:hypothetical protein ACNQQN_00050 [Mycobacteroides chelonae]|uniref:hypothetical protein n=1 Tax=Mycobacteroides chelonae TaxID=1774 RepID=UPI003AB0D5BD